jgi:hypothetical protein
VLGKYLTKTIANMKMEMKTYGEQYEIYKAWNKKKRLRDITMTYEDEWDNLFAEFYANGNLFPIISIDGKFDIKLTRGKYEYADELVQIIIGKVMRLSNFSELSTIWVFDYKYFFNLRFYKYYEQVKLDNFETMNERSDILTAVVKCHFITSKQIHVEYYMKNLLLAIMHEHFQEMKPEKLRKRRIWKMPEIVLCDEYVLKHIMKY